MTETRHACEQGDGLESYTWTQYDAREGGTQVLKDGYNNVKITTELVKVPGGKNGGSWAARIKGEPMDPGAYAAHVYRPLEIHTRYTRSTVKNLVRILRWRRGDRWAGYGNR